jgi:hypothetical protein
MASCGKSIYKEIKEGPGSFFYNILLLWEYLSPTRLDLLL